ncbi:hypothetical protein D3C81_1327010 [compost metagenome]
MIRHRVNHFAGKPQKTAWTTLDPTMTVRRINLTFRTRPQYGTLLIRGQQLAVDAGPLTRLHCQQLRAVLKNTMPAVPLQLRCQLFAAVETGHVIQPKRCQFNQTIQSVVAVCGLFRSVHRMSPPVFEQRLHPHSYGDT